MQPVICLRCLAYDAVINLFVTIFWFFFYQFSLRNFSTNLLPLSKRVPLSSSALSSMTLGAPGGNAVGVHIH